ncbi:MAG: septum formation protein Maf [Brumimicrobium sp.]|nr:septum formation protein Maf [Brumimicrobium sp.]
MFSKKIILGSSSPRRKQLLESLGVSCEIRKVDVEEIYPASLSLTEVPLYLAKLKAEPLKTSIQPGEVLLTSDTVVLLHDEIIGKPTGEEDAIQMLKKLSGNTHKVVSGVNLYSIDKEITFSVVTEVTFKPLSGEEIIYYVQEFKPFDKAGSYGIQEWIGMIGVEKINGCFYNVMGLPVHNLWKMLNEQF